MERMQKHWKSHKKLGPNKSSTNASAYINSVPCLSNPSRSQLNRGHPYQLSKNFPVNSLTQACRGKKSQFKFILNYGYLRLQKHKNYGKYSFQLDKKAYSPSAVMHISASVRTIAPSRTIKGSNAIATTISPIQTNHKCLSEAAPPSETGFLFPCFAVLSAIISQ